MRGLDAGRPSPARIRDCLLSGRHYSSADRDAAERLLAAVPEMRDAVLASRGFHQRAAAWIAEQGVRQFLDLGAGLPAFSNTHDAVRRAQPAARVVYVDSDPLVSLYSELSSGAGAETGVICAGVEDPAAILDHPAVRKLIDPGQPTGLLMSGVMAHVPDSSGPHDLAARYVRCLAPGSYLALSHVTADAKPPAAVNGCRGVFSTAGAPVHFRSRDEIARFFDGMRLEPPYAGARAQLACSGIWGAEDPDLADSEGSRWTYCGVAQVAAAPGTRSQAECGPGM